jgi:RNA polymerase sigma-70 factor (ECF subfamily)
MKDDLTAMWNRDASLPAAPEFVQEDAWVISRQRGDALAFNRLVLKWESRVYNLALRMLQHPEDAAEATQEVFLLAYKSIRRFRRDAKFSTWLYRIALNHCISRARRRPQGAHFSLDDGREGATQADRLRAPDSQEAELLSAENRRRVRGAMASLPPEQRAVVELKFFQEMTFDDIAVVLEVPLSTIKSRLYAALDSLKVRLGARA